MSQPFNAEDMLLTAARAVGKIDREGTRGAIGLTVDEITAMACTLVCFGLPALGRKETLSPGQMAALTPPQGDTP